MNKKLFFFFVRLVSSSEKQNGEGFFFSPSCLFSESLHRCDLLLDVVELKYVWNAQALYIEVVSLQMKTQGFIWGLELKA